MAAKKLSERFMEAIDNGWAIADTFKRVGNKASRHYGYGFVAGVRAMEANLRQLHDEVVYFENMEGINVPTPDTVAARVAERKRALGNTISVQEGSGYVVSPQDRVRYELLCELADAE